MTAGQVRSASECVQRSHCDSIHTATPDTTKQSSLCRVLRSELAAIDTTIPASRSWSTTWMRHYLLLCCVTFNTHFFTFYPIINALTHARGVTISAGDDSAGHTTIYFVLHCHFLHFCRAMSCFAFSRPIRSSVIVLSSIFGRL